MWRRRRGEKAAMWTTTVTKPFICHPKLNVVCMVSLSFRVRDCFSFPACFIRHLWAHKHVAQQRVEERDKGCSESLWMNGRQIERFDKRVFCSCGSFMKALECWRMCGRKKLKMCLESWKYLKKLSCWTIQFSLKVCLASRFLFEVLGLLWPVFQ